jgi:hypothetical protein
MPRQPTALVLFLATVVAVTGTYVPALFAQGFGFMRGEQGDVPEMPPRDFPDRHFVTCRMFYTSVRRESNGAGWRTDYPWGERHLSLRLSELTRTRVSLLTPQVPHAWLVRLTDDELFQCPMLMASDVGTMGLSDAEAERLHQYLNKGGFLWVDDFWGTPAWEQWSKEIAKALPSPDYVIEDVPLSDPIFRSLMEVTAVPQITSIRFWRASNGRNTSERGADSAEPHLRGIRDARGRLMVVMTHNTDVADSWEREGEDPEFFYQFSPDGYALGINVALYALTH